MVAANKSYDIVLTSTPPNKLRFRILDSDSSFKIRLSMYYYSPQRIDLYLNDKFMPPTNAYYLNGKMQLKDPNLIDMPSMPHYMPTYLNNSGTNMFYNPDRKMYFSIDGSVDHIDLVISPVLYVKFGLPAITPDQFFNTATLVGNFALLLGVDASKIRRVKIVRASSKKRQTNSLNYVYLTIYDDPVTNLTDSQLVNTIKTEMSQLDAKISNMYLTGNLQQQAQVLNFTLATMDVQHFNSNQTLKTIYKIATIQVQTQASGCRAQSPCSTQPVLVVLDENGNLASNIGTTDYPWLIQAQINSTSNPNVSLLFQTQCQVVNGYANFTQLGVSDLVDNLVISYSFALPQGLNA